MNGSPTPAIPESSVPTRSSTLATPDEDDDDDNDLGLGNSTSKRKASLNDPGARDSSTSDLKAAKPEARSRPGKTFTLSLIIRPIHPDIEEAKPNQQSSSWFTRWWSREGSGGPVKATLGEESSFVYDKELKRWVNKKVGFRLHVPSFLSEVSL
jgi:hypothetical protein